MEGARITRRLYCNKKNSSYTYAPTLSVSSSTLPHTSTRSPESHCLICLIVCSLNAANFVFVSHLGIGLKWFAKNP